MSVDYFLWKAATFSAILKTMLVLRHLVFFFVLICLKNKTFTASMTEDPGEDKTLTDPLKEEQKVLCLM